MNRASIGREVQEHFEAKWQGGDPWDLSSSEFESNKYAKQLEALRGRDFGRALEIGCGNGVFTRMIAPAARQVVALDISATAIELARSGGDAGGVIEYRVANVMDMDVRAEGPWDLVVMSETLPYIGWLYPMFDVGWLASELLGGMAPGGRLLMCNTCGGVSDYLLRRWMIDSYRDLFRNVGFELQAEDLFRGTKDGVEIESLICVFRRPE